MGMMLHRHGVASAISREFAVTVPSGTVGSNLTDFPLFIDLSDMPAPFWAVVDNNGGNIRAYESDGTTLIPVDVVFCDKEDERGAAFLKSDLASGADTDLIVKCLPHGVQALDVTDTNGRNAVWSDYEIVYHIGSDPSDRTGNHNALRINGDPDFLKQTATSGDINSHEGIATDGTYYYGFDSFYIRKFDLSWSSISTSSDLSARYSAGIGDGVVRGGKIYVPADAAGTQYLAVYSASSLAFIEDFDISAFADDAAGFTYYNGYLYTIKYNAGAGASTIIAIDPSDGSHVSGSDITLSTAIVAAQGIAFWRGAFWVPSDDTDETYRVELDGTVVVSGMFGPRTTPTTWEGIDVAPGGDGLIVVDDTGTSEVVRTFKDFDLAQSAGGGMEAWAVSRSIGDFTASALGTTWTVGISMQQATLSQVYFLGVVPTGGYSATQSVHIGVDDFGGGDYRIAAFDGSNSWLYSGSNAQSSTTVMKRVNVAYNGTSGRYLWVNGGDKGTDTTITARGTGIAHLNIGAPIENSYSAAWTGKLGGIAYARAALLSDNWIAAEYSNLNNPSGFYTIS